MGGIFICYRREDTAGWTGRLHSDLQEALDDVNIFRDIDAIPPGVKFDEYIAQAVGSCDVLIAMIGPQWLTVKDAHGVRRLDDPDDFIRLEIATCLQRDIRVIPALVGGGRMPADDELPEDIRALARRQAYELSDSRWAADANKLIAALAPLVHRGPKVRRRDLLKAAAATIVLALGGYGIWQWYGRTPPEVSAPAAVTSEAASAPTGVAANTSTPGAAGTISGGAASTTGGGAASTTSGAGGGPDIVDSPLRPNEPAPAAAPSGTSETAARIGHVCCRRLRRGRRVRICLGGRRLLGHLSGEGKGDLRLRCRQAGAGGGHLHDQQRRRRLSSLRGRRASWLRGTRRDGWRVRVQVAGRRLLGHLSRRREGDLRLRHRETGLAARAIHDQGRNSVFLPFTVDIKPGVITTAAKGGVFEFKWPGGDCWDIYRGDQKVTYGCGTGKQALQAGAYTIKTANSVFLPFEVAVKTGSTTTVAKGGVFHFKWPGGDCWDIYRGEEKVTYGCGSAKQALQAGSYTIKPSSAAIFAPFAIKVTDGATISAP